MIVCTYDHIGTWYKDTVFYSVPFTMSVTNKAYHFREEVSREM